jgi:hypothetical protein
MTACCPECQREMRCRKTGRGVVCTVDGMPYQVWHADEWTCPTCSANVLTGFGRGPLATRGDAAFDALLDAETRDGAVRVRLD